MKLQPQLDCGTLGVIEGVVAAPIVITSARSDPDDPSPPRLVPIDATYSGSAILLWPRAVLHILGGGYQAKVVKASAATVVASVVDDETTGDRPIRTRPNDPMY